jgi:hypothetical protein
MSRVESWSADNGRTADNTGSTIACWQVACNNVTGLSLPGLCAINSLGVPMKTLQEIEQAIETLPWLDRLRLYKDMPQLIGGDVEHLDWQRLALDRFFQDDSPDDQVYDHV